jgi:hypothetical protein
MDTRDEDRTVLRRRCLLRGAENRRLVRGPRESRKAGREGGEPEGLEHRSHHQRCPEGVNEVPRTPARPLPSGEAEEGR